jgi:hypothetical protein
MAQFSAWTTGAMPHGLYQPPPVVRGARRLLIVWDVENVRMPNEIYRAGGAHGVSGTLSIALTQPAHHR